MSQAPAPLTIGTDGQRLDVMAMTSVRPNPAMPLDLVRFILQVREAAGHLAEERLKEVGDTTIVTGELSVRAVQLAHEQNDIARVPEQLRAIIDSGARTTGNAELDNDTLRKLRVVGGIRGAFGSDIRALSGLDFLREDARVKDRFIELFTKWVELLRQNDSIDIAPLLAGLIARDEYLMSSSKLALSTLPPGRRNGAETTDLQLRESLYAAVEAFMATAHISEGGVYVSYEGPSEDPKKSTLQPRLNIIENMRVLAGFSAQDFLNDPTLAARIMSKDFIVDEDLDGYAVRIKDDHSRMPLRRSPHEMSGDQDVFMMPLAQPAPSHFGMGIPSRSFIVSPALGNGGGVENVTKPMWIQNGLGLIVRFCDAHKEGDEWSERIKKALQTSKTSVSEFESWLNAVRLAVQSGGSTNRLVPPTKSRNTNEGLACAGRLLNILCSAVLNHAEDVGSHGGNDKNRNGTDGSTGPTTDTPVAKAAASGRRFVSRQLNRAVGA